jgi:hypothetical protein
VPTHATGRTAERYDAKPRRARAASQITGNFVVGFIPRQPGDGTQIGPICTALSCLNSIPEAAHIGGYRMSA